LNAPLVVIAGWIINKPIDLNFEIFMIVIVVLSILVVGNFLRDGASNYLEGCLLVIIYGIVGVASWFYPNPVLDWILWEPCTGDGWRDVE